MIENRIEYTSQGYSYTPVTVEECLKWGGYCICDSCNEVCAGGYLIYILSSYLCENCFKVWQQRARQYDEDLERQKKEHVWYYENYLKVK